MKFRDNVSVGNVQIAEMTCLNEKRCVKIIIELTAGKEAAEQYLELEGVFMKEAGTIFY